jgi:phosphoribosylglycinamide formyltransferase-1
MSIKKCVVLFSGTGSNLENLLVHQDKLKDKLKYIHAFTDNSDAGGINVCKKYNLQVTIGQKENINKDLERFIANVNPDLIILSGYMKIIPPNIVEDNIGRIINIHPSLLPKYPGLKTYEKVISNKDESHGATVHFVTKELDQGPIILQGKFLVNNKMTKSYLEKLTHKTEYIIFPIVIEWFADNLLEYHNNSVILKNEIIVSPIIYMIHTDDL